LPAPPLRGRVLGAAAVGCLAVTGLAVAAHAWLSTIPAQPVIGLAIFGAMIAVALVTIREDHPFPHFGAANWVTMTRGVLVALAASLIAEPARSAVAWLLIGVTATVAGLDGIDGWLARRTRMSSAFGARFDMETDAFFMLVLAVAVWRHDKAGIWVIAIGLMRYGFVAARWAWPWLAQPLRSTRRGKAVAIGQFVFLGIALLPVMPAASAALACGLGLAALAWSFALDVWFLYKKEHDPGAVLL
jgi:phosphatidylglycerophosphate synthase